MLDPKEQAKGGFRAQLERQRETQDTTAADGAAAAKAPDGTPTPSRHQAEDADAANPAGTAESTTPPARRPKRWH